MMDATVSTLQTMGLALSLPVLYAAWYEYAQRNLRDARLLAGCGTGGLLLVIAGFTF